MPADACFFATNATTRILVVSRSSDGGASWTSHLAYAGPLGTSIQNLFPILAVDHGGNAYAAPRLLTGKFRHREAVDLR